MVIFSKKLILSVLFATVFANSVFAIETRGQKRKREAQQWRAIIEDISKEEIRPTFDAQRSNLRFDNNVQEQEDQTKSNQTKSTKKFKKSDNIHVCSDTTLAEEQVKQKILEKLKEFILFLEQQYNPNIRNEVSLNTIIRLFNAHNKNPELFYSFYVDLMGKVDDGINEVESLEQGNSSDCGYFALYNSMCFVGGIDSVKDKSKFKEFLKLAKQKIKEKREQDKKKAEESKDTSELGLTQSSISSGDEDLSGGDIEFLQKDEDIRFFLKENFNISDEDINEVKTIEFPDEDEMQVDGDNIYEVRINSIKETILNFKKDLSKQTTVVIIRFNDHWTAVEAKKDNNSLSFNVANSLKIYRSNKYIQKIVAIYEDDEEIMECDVEKDKKLSAEEQDEMIKNQLINFLGKDHPNLKRKYNKQPDNFKFSFNKKIRFGKDLYKWNEKERQMEPTGELKSLESGLLNLQTITSSNTPVMIAYDDGRILFSKAGDLPIIFNGEVSPKFENNDSSFIHPYQKYERSYKKILNLKRIIKKRGAIEGNKTLECFRNDLNNEINHFNTILGKRDDRDYILKSKNNRPGGYIIVEPTFLDLDELKRLANGERFFEEDVLFIGLKLLRPENKEKEENKNCSQKINLRGLSLRSAILIGSDFSNADLNGSDFSGSNLSCANLSDSILVNSTMVGTIFNDANLAHTDFSSSILQYAIFRNANLFNSKFLKSNLVKTDLTGVDFQYSDLTGSNLTKSDLSCANLAHSNLRENTNLTEAILVNTNLFDAKMEGIITTNMRIEEGTNFREATIYNIKFNTKHSLKNITFEGATLVRVYFVNCILDNVNMKEVKSDALVLNNTRLNKVDFWNAKLNNLYSYNTDNLGNEINFELATITGGVFLGRDNGKTLISNSNFKNVSMPNTFWGNFRYKNCFGLEEMEDLDQSTFEEFEIEFEDGSKQTGVTCRNWFCGWGKDEIVNAMKAKGAKFNKYISDDFKSVRSDYQNGWVKNTGLRLASIAIDSAVSASSYGLLSNATGKLFKNDDDKKQVIQTDAVNIGPQTITQQVVQLPPEQNK